MAQMEVSQLAGIVNDLIMQSQGAPLSAVDTEHFISVANTALETGYDPLLNAISQVLSRTLFSIRPYTRKFKEMQVDNIKWGNHVRKVQIEDKDFEQDQRLNATDGTAIDQQIVNAPSVLQTNFYGERVYQKSTTTYKDQLDVALNGPEEFARFLTMQMTNVSDMIEQCHEATARFTMANLMASAYRVHLITDYNTLKGVTLTYPDIFKKDNFTDFIEFAYAHMKTYSNYLTERTILYHTQLTAKPRIERHTPVAYQHMYVLSRYNELAKTTVLSSVFNDEYLRQLDFEMTNFWQSMDTPEKINGDWTYLKADGTLDKHTALSAPIFALLWDTEAMGYVVVNTWAAPAPFNARGGYTTTYWHFTDRFWNDFTENAVAFYLD